MTRIAKLVVCLGCAGAAFASAATRYGVVFRNAAVVAGTEMKPGDYTVEVNGSKAMIRGGKQTVEAPIQVQQSDRKFSSTTVRYNIVDGKYKVTEIQVGGTKTRLVFDDGSVASTPAPAAARP
ncbi:MAG TPA: hypothetical protein VGR73_12955 [Bryobacteraceae bacterium]|nr:hypothetical protein [Bryobacteraceae bacterium]